MIVYSNIDHQGDTVYINVLCWAHVFWGTYISWCWSLYTECLTKNVTLTKWSISYIILVFTLKYTCVLEEQTLSINWTPADQYPWMFDCTGQILLTRTKSDLRQLLSGWTCNDQPFFGMNAIDSEYEIDVVISWCKLHMGWSWGQSETHCPWVTKMCPVQSAIQGFQIWWCQINWEGLLFKYTSIFWWVNAKIIKDIDHFVSVTFLLRHCRLDPILYSLHYEPTKWSLLMLELFKGGIWRVVLSERHKEYRLRDQYSYSNAFIYSRS